MTAELLVVGDVNPDLVLSGGDVQPRFGQREGVVEAGALLVGGSAAITACGAARLGVATALAGVVGADALGRFMLDELRGRGVDVAGVRVSASEPTGVSVILSRGEDRAILTALGTIGAVELADVVAALEGVRHVHLSALGLQPGLVAALPALAQSVHATGATLSADPNWDPTGRWELAGALDAVDVVFPNETEALRLAGREDADVEAAAATLAARGGVGPSRGPLVVVTLGAAGALAHDGTRVVCAAAPVVDVVDATGAGDSFAAGFLAARLDGAELEEALRFACACGALSTGAMGGTAAQATREQAASALRAPA